MQNKNKFAMAQIPLNRSQNPWYFRPKGLPILLGLPIFFSIFNVVFNIVKINLSSKYLHGTPYSTADFSPREFQANQNVTVKVLSLLDKTSQKTA